ncbi:MAG TPA: acetylxylan esterase [Mariniphaga sp.]|nr:acetylxylan esterase [Mariniphaga sp.]
MTKIRLNLCCLWVVFMVTAIGLNAQDKSVSVLDSYKSEPTQWMIYTNTGAALYNHIASHAEKLLAEREKTVSQLHRKEDWLDYTAFLKNSFSDNLSSFSKTPLNARMTGRLNREDFVAEKIVFESQPGFFVTGCLFIPKVKKQKKFPAVIVPTGHSQAAFRRDIYQQTTLNLVKKGFVVFTFDPLGQGERVQYLDTTTNQSYIGGSTSEHSYAGAQSLLTGNSISDYFIWDGIRAIDYVSSRLEVDPDRIGMTGVSGGGTQTAFIAAYDDRVRAAAPESYITGFHRLFESIGPQDAEQNLYKGLLKGIDHVDLLAMRAPKPTMIISTTQDFFSIQGARETYAKSKEIFNTFNKPDNIKMIEADGVHGSKKDNRQGMYGFFQKELNLPLDTIDLEVNPFDEEELNVTNTGQVVSAFNSKTVYDFNKERAILAVNERAIKDANDLKKNREQILDRIMELSGLDTTRQIKSVVYSGKVEKENYKIQKYFIQGHDFDYPIPFVLIKPYTTEQRPLLFYLGANGKDDLIANDKEITAYINKGYTILAPDVLGTGELKNTVFKGDSYIQDYSFNLFLGANLVGKCIAGFQASDLYILFKALANLKGVNTKDITAVVKDEACSSYLHFAVFNKSIDKTLLMNPLISFEDVATTRNYLPEYLWTAVPEAIHYYDLVHLQALLPQSNLIVVNPVSATGESISSEATDNQFKVVKDAYSSTDRKLELILSDEDNSSVSILNLID